jgi:probable rRNA maturation factor
MGDANALRVQYSSAVRRGAPARRHVVRWARAALGTHGPGSSLSVRVVGAAAGRELNRTWRGRDYATNVLSFPVLPGVHRFAPRAGASDGGPRLLGDVVLSAPVVVREAGAQGKSLHAHWAHLVVHGCLHLIGLDHEREPDARRMERRERRVLAGLGIADPYRVAADE